jgi:lysophospholipase L1-like esterase
MPDCLSGTLGYIPSMIAAEQDFNYYDNRRTYFSRQDASMEGDPVIFIGDSNIDGMDVSRVCEGAALRGIGGDTQRGGLNRINFGGSANSIHRARAVVWMLGTNDTFYESDGCVLNLPFMWDQLAMGMTGKWVACHVLPVGQGNLSAHNGKTGAQLNACIDTTNAYINTKFAGNQNVAIVNVKSTLAPNGYLDPQYTIDGVHLSKAGCDVWRAAVRTALTGLGVSGVT